MAIVSIIASVAYVLLTIFWVLMMARLVLDLVVTFVRGWRPRGLGLVLAEIVYTVTDPPVKLVRRVVPPLRVGGVAIDFAWTIVLLAVIILQSMASGFIA